MIEEVKMYEEIYTKKFVPFEEMEAYFQYIQGETPEFFKKESEEDGYYHSYGIPRA